MYFDSQIICRLVTAEEHADDNHGHIKIQMRVFSDSHSRAMENWILYMELGPVNVDII